MFDSVTAECLCCGPHDLNLPAVNDSLTYQYFFLLCVGDKLLDIEVNVHTRTRGGCNRRTEYNGGGGGRKGVKLKESKEDFIMAIN